MVKHSFGKGISVFTGRQPGHLLIKFHKIVAGGKTPPDTHSHSAQRDTDFQYGHVGIRQHEIGLVNLCLHNISF